MRTLEGNLVAKGMKVGIVCARFNEFITSKLELLSLLLAFPLFLSMLSHPIKKRQISNIKNLFILVHLL